MLHSRITLLPAVLCALLAESQAAEKTTVVQSGNLGNVIHIEGLAEIKDNVKGILTLTPDDLVFTRESINAHIRDSGNSNVFETQIETSKRINSDSLKIANVVAKSIAKRLRQVFQKAGE